MRVESSVTSVSWIPSEAIRGITKLPFELKVGHYDSAPPDHIDDVRELKEGAVLTRQGDDATELYVILDARRRLTTQHHREDPGSGATTE